MARRGSYSFILLGQHAVNALNPGRHLRRGSFNFILPGQHAVNTHSTPHHLIVQPSFPRIPVPDPDGSPVRPII